jgi:hypothetical protein
MRSSLSGLSFAARRLALPFCAASVISCGSGSDAPQEERINDVFVIREVSDDEARDIQQCGLWPDNFNNYETLLRLSQEAGRSARFMDSRCATLQRTAKNLIDDRLDIDDEEIADLLNVSIEDASWLRQAASEGRDAGLGA